VDHGLGVAFFISERPNDMQVSMHLSIFDPPKKTHSQKHDVNFKVETKDIGLLVEEKKSLHDASYCKEVPKLINSHQVFESSPMNI
jgi:hypothetical protein